MSRTAAPARHFLRMTAAVVRGGDEPPPWPQLPARSTILTHQGRSAIGLACSILGLRPADEVLMPSYNCGVEVDAIRAAGLAVRLYRVDARARADADDVRRRVTHRTRVLYVIHYFGWPQPLGELRALCRDRGLLLFEDCALALFSADGSHPLGRAADAAIYSFPKSLPVPDGGALVLRDAPASGRPKLVPPPGLRVMRRALGIVASRLGISRRRSGRTLPEADSDCTADTTGARRPDMPPSYYWDAAGARCSMSRLTRALLGGFDAAEVIARRRANYARLCERISGVHGVEPLFGTLPDGTCPLHLPLLVSRRDAWVEALRARGVASIAWWKGHHRALAWNEFPDACCLKADVLALPVGQSLDAHRVDVIAGHVAGVARELARDGRALEPAPAAPPRDARVSPESRARHDRSTA